MRSRVMPAEREPLKESACASLFVAGVITTARMLNAIEPGTLLPIHRHRESSETVVMLRGKAPGTTTMTPATSPILSSSPPTATSGASPSRKASGTTPRASNPAR